MCPTPTSSQRVLVMPARSVSGIWSTARCWASFWLQIDSAVLLSACTAGAISASAARGRQRRRNLGKRMEGWGSHPYA